MKRYLMTSLLALPMLGLCQDEASAFFSICGQHSCSYSFSCPRVIFGFEWGCAPCGNPGPRPAGGGIMPWFAQFPQDNGYWHAQGQIPAPAAVPQAPAAPANTATPAPATTQPASYQFGTVPAGGYNYYNPYNSGSYAPPAYWYGR